jgi:membrane associated rhomboid family serine protease
MRQLFNMQEQAATTKEKRFSIATITIAIICVITYLAQLVTAAAPVKTVLLHPDANYLLIDDVLTFLLSIHGIGISCGFFWTPFTYMFLHGSWSHLLFNMIGLLTIGTAIERQYGLTRFLIIYFLGGILGGIGWVLLSGLTSTTPCIGASAGVLALVGAYVAKNPRDKLIIFVPLPIPMPAWLLATLIFAGNAIEFFIKQTNIAASAHLIGIAFGAILGLFFFKTNLGEKQ